MNFKTVIIVPLILLLGATPSAFATQYNNYTAPEGRSIKFPSDWLVGYNTITGINGTKMSENASKFIPFDGQYSNVSVSIGITSRVNNQSYTSLFRQGDSQLNCGTYFIAGHNTCVRVFPRINDMAITSTNNGNDYLFDFRGGTQTEFETALPVFMQMLTTFTPK
ncbi:MAG: hypothetical protein WAM14_01470 [Candidatus Nitrosopolaris sp.]